MRISSRTGVGPCLPTTARQIGGGLVGLAVVLATATLGGFGPVAAEGSGPADRPATLIERAGCDQASSQPERTESTAGSRDLQQVVSVVVPATALLRVDHGGHVVAAATNTGCAPRPGDDLFYVRPDGTIKQAPTTHLGHRRWIGDFTTSGVFVSQRR